VAWRRALHAKTDQSSMLNHTEEVLDAIFSFCIGKCCRGEEFFDDIRNGWWQTPDPGILSRRQLKRRLNVLNGDSRETSP